MAEPLSVNHQIQVQAVNHLLGLKLYDKSVVKSISRLLTEVEADLVGQVESRLSKALAKGVDPGPWSTQRVNTLLAEVRLANREAYTVLGKELKAELQDLAKVEAAWQVNTVNAATPAAISWTKPTAAQLKAIVTDLPLVGSTMVQEVSKQAANQFQRISSQVAIGLTQGESVPQMVSRVRGTFKIGRAHAESLVRTATTHVASATRIETFKANADAIKGMQFVATLDGRTTLLCAKYDGRVDQVGAGPIPPLHYRCRSTLVPVLRSWRELGINAGELSTLERASMDGKVPAALKFGDWMRLAETTNPGFFDSYYGKYAPWMRANPDLGPGDLIDRLGNEITLLELAAKEGVQAPGSYVARKSAEQAKAIAKAKAAEEVVLAKAKEQSWKVTDGVVADLWDDGSVPGSFIFDVQQEAIARQALVKAMDDAWAAGVRSSADLAAAGRSAARKALLEAYEEAAGTKILAEVKENAIDVFNSVTDSVEHSAVGTEALKELYAAMPKLIDDYFKAGVKTVDELEDKLTDALVVRLQKAQQQAKAKIAATLKAEIDAVDLPTTPGQVGEFVAKMDAINLDHTVAGQVGQIAHSNLVDLVAKKRAQVVEFLNSTDIKTLKKTAGDLGMKWSSKAKKDQLVGWLFGSKNAKAVIQQQVTEHAKALKAALKAKKEVAAPAPKGKPGPGKAASVEVLDGSGWQSTGQALGSNPGGMHQAPDGTKWYVKFAKDDPARGGMDHLREEMVANRLYQAAGINVPETQFVQIGDRVGIASKVIDGQTGIPGSLLRQVDGVTDGFATDAWLANWDVVGLSDDNILVHGFNHATNKIEKGATGWRIDVGGSLRYRAQGKTKGTSFGEHVGELSSLRDGTNAKSSAVFGHLKESEIVAQVESLAATFSDDVINRIVDSVPDLAGAPRLKSLLKARRDDLVKQSKSLKAAAAAEKELEALIGGARKLGAGDRDWMDSQYQAWLSSLPDTEKRAVSTYTGSSYQSINSELRAGKSAFDIEADLPNLSARTTVGRIERALGKAKAPEDIVVWRKFRSREIQARVKESGAESLTGTTFRDWGYSSTSIRTGVWSGEIEAMIVVRKNTRGAAWVRPISQHRGEDELLIQRGTRYKVLQSRMKGSLLQLILEVVK